MFMPRYAVLLSALVLTGACNDSSDDSDTDVGTESAGESAFLTRVFPADGDVDVAIDTVIEVEFTAPVTTGDQVITLRRAGNAVREPVTIEWLTGGTTLLATPDSPLLHDVEYTVEIDESVQSANPAGDDFGQGWSFFTEPAPAPRLLSSVPRDDSDGNSVFIDVSATFDTAINPASVTAESAYVENALTGSPEYGDLSVSGATVTWLPYSDLAPDTLYTLVLTTNIEDMAGNGLEQDIDVTFGTVPALTVSTSIPSAGSENVSIDQPLVLTFSQNIDASLITNESLVVEVNGLFQNTWYPDMPGEVTVSGDTLTFTPAGGTWQEFETNYTVRVDYQSVRGTGGQPLQSPTIRFSTEFVSPNWSYHLFTEGSGRGQFLQTYADPQTLFMGSGDTSSSRWRFSANNNGTYGVRTDYGGLDLWLEGGDGTTPSVMTTGGLFTGQQWRFTSYGGHPSTWAQQGYESPSIYYMETVFQGPDRALTMLTPPGGTWREGTMADKTGLIHSLFWLKRMSPIN